MVTLTLSFDPTVMNIVALDILILFSYILYLFHKKRKIALSIAEITMFIQDYFQHTGAQVDVICFKLDSDKHFVTLIESEPLKRFRYSNILESNLIAHIQKKTGNTVEKIYWRFPVQVHELAALAKGKGPNDVETEAEDDYFVDVKVVEDHSHDYNVSEATWDDFKSSEKQDRK
ncbi:MAG: hypothetical protein PHD12_10025 [Methylotenera sp.]|nr:hypothetical protein [Methylotenera sp.]